MLFEADYAKNYASIMYQCLLVIHCFLRVNFLFRKFVGCGGPKLTGGASGRGVLRGTFGQGQKKKKKKKETMGITLLPPRRFLFLILFSFCLPTVQLHFTPILNFKQSTHAKKNLSSVFSYPLCTFLFYFFINKRHTHTHAHTQRALLGCY